MELTNRHKVTILFAEGIAQSMRDAYFMCVDMGEFAENESLRTWAFKQDKLMVDETLSAREYIAKYGRQYT